MDIKKIKRNELDIIVTDLLPVEISKMFTIKNFYDFLFSKSSALESIIDEYKDIKYSNKELFKNGWHATPLKYNVYKKDQELRQISLLHPFSMIQIYYFIALYNDELLDQLSQNNIFSIRYHTRNNDLYFRSSKKGVISYTHDKTNRYIEVLQSSGIFYDIVQYKFLSRFYTSDEWFKVNSEYKYFAKIDYKDCFGSIYTHSYKWIVTNNPIDSRNFKNNHLLSVIDRLLQNTNSSISNGIQVGPEFYRMIAEILLQRVDYEVYIELTLKNKTFKKDYNIFRYVDDIFVFTNDEELRESIVSLYSEKSLKYQLKLNELKNEKGKLPQTWSIWKRDTKHFIREFEDRFFYKHNDTNQPNYYIKSNNFSNRIKHRSPTKEQFQNLLAIYPEEDDKITSYFLSALLNGIKDSKRERILSESITVKKIVSILDVFIYIYSFSPTYTNTQKFISIIYLLEKEVGLKHMKEALADAIKQYNYVFEKANLEDIADFITIIGLYQIELPYSLEEDLMNRVFEKENPIMAASFLSYSQYNEHYAKEVSLKLQKHIKEKLSVITDPVNVLLYDEMWWAFIFWNCPYFDNETNDLIREKVSMLKESNENKFPSDQTKMLVYDFFNNTNIQTKFIKWKMTSEELIEDIAYVTFERTLFRGNNSDGPDEYN